MSTTEPNPEPSLEPRPNPNPEPKPEPNEQGKEVEKEEGNKEEVKQEVKEEPKEEKTEEQKKKKDEPKEEKKESWKDFIYNPRTGEFMGRTATSWGLILLFYLVFYGFLAGMFLLTMWVMLQTLDENVPCRQDRVAHPGLVIRPHAAEISFNRSDPSKYSEYTRQLHDLLQRYNDSIQERNDLCMVGEYTEQDNEPVKKVCQFKRSTLRQCSGLSDTSFGYAAGKPCIIIKMNRVIGLRPRGDPYINCTAKRDKPLNIKYFPLEGRLDKMFFPYYGKKAHPDYVQPVVAVQLLLTKEDYDVEQTVECKVEGSDLRNNDDRDKFLGRVIFRVKVSE
ncbi:sodium/potassium-transporting ATPase subunit beta-3-like [Cheilinus undulatus]|uniref:sodium/potassium-transporting ATPase subunit beta-3-like n=1 Tax=Cheilinus undulatus TaxID=241271 RepID=UPI001BD4579B|nr:sodium/potassium-transporting ATPase subunit beta-3-like [Cheilinus undulatus]